MASSIAGIPSCDNNQFQFLKDTSEEIFCSELNDKLGRVTMVVCRVTQDTIGAACASNFFEYCHQMKRICSHSIEQSTNVFFCVSQILAIVNSCETVCVSSYSIKMGEMHEKDHQG